MRSRFSHFMAKKVRASTDEVVMDLYVRKERSDEWKLKTRYTWRFYGTITPAPENDDMRKYIQARAGVYASGYE